MLSLIILKSKASNSANSIFRPNYVVILFLGPAPDPPLEPVDFAAVCVGDAFSLICSSYRPGDFFMFSAEITPIF